MNLNSFILPQHQDLVLSQPGLTARIASLHRHLSESSDARMSFLNSPETLLTEYLGVDLRESLGVSAFNRIFHRLLNSDPPPPTPGQKTHPAKGYLPLLRQALAGHSDEAISSALTRGFNVDVKATSDLRAALQVRVSTELQAITEIEARLATALEAKLHLETKANVNALLEQRLHTNTVIELELRTKVDAVLHAALETRAAVLAKAALELETRAIVDTKIDTLVESEIAIESEVETQVDFEIDAEVDLDTEADADTDIDVSAETDLESETDLRLEAELEAEAEAGVEGPAIRKRKASGDQLSRLDLQRLAGLVVDHPIVAELILSAPSAPIAGDVR